jgi:trans-aconitate 2-methyltransferase
MWDPAAYGRFGAERSRPFADLLARVGARRPRAVVDLGCGPGELTATLAGRWPGARVTGLDSSPEMIARAAALGAPVEFRLGDVREWRPAPDVDVLVSNAVLQWVPGHGELLIRWAGELPPGAWLAVQVPGNFAAPSHRALREVARSRPFAAVAGDLVRDAPVDDAAGYAALLTAAGAAVDAWETTYVHLLPAAPEHPVLGWLEGTALRPVRAVLDDAAWGAFRAALADRLAAAYPARGGVVPFPFRRVFVVARTGVARRAGADDTEPGPTGEESS